MSFIHAMQSSFTRNVEKIRAINRRYEQPRLTVTPAVRWSLLALRFYLLFLVALLAYKFFTIVAE